ncbi:MAG: penicillin acylase family protein [Myxococcota bacterium]
MRSRNLGRYVFVVGLLMLTACGDDEAEGAAEPHQLGHGGDVMDAGGAGADVTEQGDTSTTNDTAAVTDVVEGAAGPDEEGIASLLGVEETRRWVLPGLHAEVHVVRTEAGVPHIYAEGREDLSRAYGFVTAQDRFFMIDLARRLGSGRLTELLGDPALPNDMEARGVGMAYVADRIEAHLSETQGQWVDAFAAGINAYIAEVTKGTLPPPSELALAAPLLGAEAPSDLMADFTRRDVAAMLAAVIYESSFETGDVGRAHGVAAMASHYEGAALQSLRRLGAWKDIHADVAPIKPVASAPGFGTNGVQTTQLSTAAQGLTSAHVPAVATPPQGLLEGLAVRLDAFQKRLLRDHDVGFGSNAWAVTSEASDSGASILAGDGHLPLSVPSILTQVGLDTSVFGGGDLHQLGLTIPGLPMMPIGTNGDVAWSQTQFGGDITDWYAEEVTLDDAGLPTMTRVGSDWKPLTRVEESYVIADVPLLGSEGRTMEGSRWVTVGGRWMTAIEGREPTEEELDSGDPRIVWLLGQAWICGDEDEDGVVSGVSFDYVGLDISTLLSAVDELGMATDVQGFREACRGLTAYSQNLVAIDSAGSAFYTGYQPLPCRGYLDREVDGAWAEGANPALLLDGARYPGFTMPVGLNGVDPLESAAALEQCAVPFEAWPQALNPESGYVLTGNNDPGGLSFDGSLTNDAYYLGGPWDVGFRADAIERGLKAMVEGGGASVQGMAALQGEHRSSLGEHFTQALLDVIDAARGADPLDGPEAAALAGLYASRSAAIDEVSARLGAWADAGYIARSGVETFYQSVEPSHREDAVATMIFNAWFPRVLQAVFDDEGLPGIWQGSGGKVRALERLLSGRGEGNPGDLASWNPDTGESAFFDVLGTDEIERSGAVIMGALDAALAFLQGPPAGAGKGGFGTDDMSEWLWGMRHQVRFESILADFLGDDPAYALLTDTFAINTDTLPLATNYTPGDPRAALRWFPRDGDQYSVDACNPGFSGTNFQFGSGPVMRMVIALKPGEVSGQNIIPGGQSGLTDSDHFSDQAALWLANQTVPLRFHPADVAEGAIGREVFGPSEE